MNDRWCTGAGLLLPAVALCACLALQPAHAQESLPAVFPALANLPAPDWVREGLRINYHVMTATVGGNQDTPGVAGESILQVDVVALERTKAALQTRMMVRATDGLHPSPATGMVGMASCAGDWWAHPSVFAGTLPRDPTGATAMTRMPYNVAGQTYDAVRIEHKSDRGTGIWVFDTKTGVLLSMQTSTVTGDNRKQQSVMTFLGMRMLQLPWLGLPPNPLVATFSGFNAQGSYQVSVAGGPPVTLGMSMQAQILDRGTRWILYRQTNTMTAATPMPANPDTSIVACGPGQMGGLLLPAGAAARLSQGQTLDTDTLTGARYYVAQTGPQGLVLCEELPLTTTWWHYDARGFCDRLLSETRGFTAIRIDVMVQGR